MNKHRVGQHLAAGMILLTPALSLAQDLERSYLHPKLLNNEVTLRKLVILPPAVQVNKHGVKGQEGMGEAAEKASGLISIEVEAALREKGVSMETPFTDAVLGANDELKTALADVQRQFDDVAPKLFSKKRDVKKGRFTVGDGVAVLNTKGDADALVIVRALGAQETNAKAFMKRGLLPMMLTRGKVQYHSRLALVDAKSGDILFLGDYQSWGTPGSKLFEQSFKKLPVKAQ